MSQTIHIIALFSILALVITGCVKTVQPQNADKAQDTNPLQAKAAPTSNIISGELTSVDNLNSDLNNNELKNTDAQLAEISW